MSDGRQLGYQDLGKADGPVMFFFHGTPGSRLAFVNEDLIVELMGVRAILPDRPGYGISDPKPDRSLLDWPDDVLELANQLEIDSFAVAGESGGGPHALACAYSCPDRVTMALLLASPSPARFKGATRGMSFGNRLGHTLSRFAPWMVQWMIHQGAAAFDKDPEAYLNGLAMQMAEPDKDLLKKDAFRAAIKRDFREAYRQGASGHVVDAQLTLSVRNWGFKLSSIQPPVFIWHGDADTLVTQKMAEYLAAQLPNSTLNLVTKAGHMLTERPDVLKQMHAAIHGQAAN